MPTVMHKVFKLAGFIPGIISVVENEHNGAIRISLILWRHQGLQRLIIGFKFFMYKLVFHSVHSNGNMTQRHNSVYRNR